MDRPKRKAINFDLDTTKMKSLDVYPNGYKQIKKTLKDCGFIHRQGSGYVSKNEIIQADVMDTVMTLVDKHSWFVDCVNKLDVTDVGKQYDLIIMVTDFASDDGKRPKKSSNMKEDNLSAQFKHSSMYKDNVEKFGQKTADKMLAESIKNLSTQEKNGRWLSSIKEINKLPSKNPEKVNSSKSK
ncbi:MAG: hypothetical protein K2P32_02915 [Clostridia bacterium]|nr:hypothetical protein [Clostridia bacterium]